MDDKEKNKIEQSETQKKEKEKDKKKISGGDCFNLSILQHSCLYFYVSHFALKSPNFFRKITNSYTF